jgi:hypothetical protein
MNLTEAGLIPQAQMDALALAIQIRLGLHGEDVGGLLQADRPIAIQLPR